MAGTVAATLLVVVAAYRFRSSRQDRSLPARAALPGNVNQQLSGYTFTRSEGGRRIFTVRAVRTVALKQGGTTELEDVVVDVFGREGDRHDVLRTGLAEYNPQSGNFSSRGSVEIELNADPPPGGSNGRQPAYLETSNVTFRQQGSLVVSDAPVRFRAGPVSGSALGMTYATKDGWVELEKDVRVELQPAAQNVTLAAHDPKSTIPFKATAGPGLEAGVVWLTAQRLRYDKDSREVALRGPVELTQGNRRIVAGRGTVFLDSRNRLTEMLLCDEVRAFETADRSSASPGEGVAIRYSASSRPTPSGPGSSPEMQRERGPLPEALEASAQRARGIFDPASGQLRKLVAEGGFQADSRRGGGDRKQPSVSRLEAEQFEMTFEGVHSEPRSGVASGNVRLSVNSSATSVAPKAVRGGRPPEAKTARATVKVQPATQTETMTAAEMTFDFRAVGRSLKRAQTVGAGKLVLVPQNPAQGAQTITAGQFVMAFDDRSRLETLSGLSGTRSVSDPPAGAPPGVGPRETSSERLEAAFDPPTGALVAALQSGNFQFSDGEQKASAEQAEYSSPTQVLTLTGHPKVWDTVTRVNAERVLLHLDTDTAEGIGKVQSTHFGAETASRPVQAGAGLKPGATSGSVSSGGVKSGGATPNAATGTTNVLADRMLATRPGQWVHYEGHVRAWQGADVVEATSLDYNGKERRLSSGSGVVTSHLAPASGIPATGILGSSTLSGPASSGPGAAGRKKEQSHPLTVRADHLDFFDEGRKASYRGNVELETESTKLRADRLDVYFQAESAPGGSEVERAVADGHVRVTQPGRRATGDHLEYEAAAGRIVMKGGSPALYDEARSFTTGQRLTFFIHDDKLLVDGGEKSRALSEYRMPQ